MADTPNATPRFDEQAELYMNPFEFTHLTWNCFSKKVTLEKSHDFHDLV